MLGVVALAAVAAALGLYLVLERAGASGVPFAILRAVAWGSVALLLLDPGCRRAGSAAPPVVLLDRSLSMSDPGDGAGGAGGARWRAAVDSARAIAGRAGRILVFGAEPAAFREGVRPDAPSSRLLPAWREAVSLGGPVAVVTDGELDDARDLPADFRRTRVVVLPRPPRPDVGVAGLDLPLSLRAGDTVTATISLVAAGTGPSDTATLELLEGTRRVARERVAVGAGGSFVRELRFVPAAPAGDREIRRYVARVGGAAADAEPRDDARSAVSEVARASAIALYSDSPDWDFRALVTTLGATSGVPVRAFVHVVDGPWRDAGTLKAVSQREVSGAARDAALVVVHGTAQGAAPILAVARRSVWRWTTAHGPAGAGDWYVAPAEAPSPLGAALAGVPSDSLPPLEAVGEAAGDSGAWVGLAARLARRGRPRAVITGSDVGSRRNVHVLGSGLWRWASKGGVAAEGYRALTAAITDWLLAEVPRQAAELTARRDSLNRGLDEFLPRPRAVATQAGLRFAAAGEPEPLRHLPWAYAAALAALVLEWIARRRRGMR